MRVEVYGVSARTWTNGPTRANTDPVTLLVWLWAEELFTASEAALTYYGIDTYPDRCVDLRIRVFPTVRLLIGGREIGRSDAAFLTREELVAWVRERIDHFGVPGDFTRAAWRGAV
jgi:hypothetical protein